MTTSPGPGKLSPRFSAWVTLVFLYVYLAWGTTYLAIHWALAGIPPFIMAGGRFVIAGTVLLVLVRLFQPAKFHWGRPGEWRDALVVGAMLLVGGNGCMGWAQQYVDSSEAALIFGSTPLCIILFDWLRPGGIAPSLRVGLGIALGLVGLGIVFAPSSGAPASGMEIWGKCALVFAVCSWSAGAIYSRHVHARGSAVLPMARQMILAGAVLMTLSVFHGDWSRFSFGAVTALSWAGFWYLVVFGSLLGFTGYIWLMRVSTPARVSTITNVNVVIAVLVGWLIAGDPMTVWRAVGAGIIVASVAIVLKKKETPAEIASGQAEP